MEVTPTRRIKVCIVINDFLIGGAQKLMIDLLERLDRDQFELTLITLFQFGHDELYDSVPKGATACKLNFKNSRDIAAWFTLMQTLRTHNPDVVLSNLFFSNTLVRVLKPLFRFRVITIEHNTYTGKTRFERFIDRVLVLVTYRIVAVSKTVALFTSRQEGIAQREFIVINNGIDIERLQRECALTDVTRIRAELGLFENERVIIDIARLLPQKNQKLLLEGFALFTQNHPDYRLILVGDGKSRVELEREVDELGIPSRVLFLGYRHDIPQLLTIADFFVSTSLIEGFGIAHAEALACGVPVLTTKTAGPDEMIEEGKNGFFIATYTPEAVREGMEKMVAGNLVAMSDEARKVAQRYAIDCAIKSYEDLFVGAIREKAKDRP